MMALLVVLFISLASKTEKAKTGENFRSAVRRYKQSMKSRDSKGPKKSPSHVVWGSRQPLWIWIDIESESTDPYELTKPYQRICMNTAVLHSKRKFDLRILTPSNVAYFFPQLKDPLIASRFRFIPSHMRRDFVKYGVLALHGGVWITPETLVFGDLEKVFSSLARTDCLLMGSMRVSCPMNTNCSVPDHRCLMAKPDSPVMTHVAESMIDLLFRAHPGPEYLWNIQMAKRISSAERATSHKVLFYPEITFDVNETEYFETSIADPKRRPALWWTLDRAVVEKNRNFAWFSVMSEGEILNHSMWISRLMRQAYGTMLPTRPEVVERWDILS